LSIFSLNIQSISAKFQEFLELINLFSAHNCSPDVICLQELWRFPEYANFSLPGYNPLIFKLRNSNTQGGGVGIFIKSNIKFTILHAQSIFIDRIFESLFVQLELSNFRKIIVGTVYRPGTAHPSLSGADAFENFLEVLTNVFDELTSLKHSIYLTGDTNLDVLQHSSSSQISDYINVLTSYGMLQVITKPTRCTDHSATIIDHMITNANHSAFESLVFTSRVSDHFPILLFVPTSKPRSTVKVIHARDFSDKNITKFKETLHSISWQTVRDEEDSQIAYNVFSDIFFNLYEIHFPKREIKFNKKFHNLEPWMSKGLLVSRLEKIRLASLSSKHPTALNLQNYKNYRNLFNKLLRCAKKLYFEKELAKNVSNLKKTWEIIKSATNSCRSNINSISKLTINNVSVTDPFQIACKS